MDKEQLQKTIAEYYGKLPKEAQEVFSSMAWMGKLKDIGIKYSLDENQMEILGTETTLVLLGIIHIEEYNATLETELKQSKEITDKIISEVNTNIFNQIKEQLIKTFESNAIFLNEKENPTVTQPKPVTSAPATPTPVFDPRFSNMPQNVQEAIRKSNWKEKLYKLAQKYSLNVEQSGILEEITTKVMQNAIHPDHYESELASKLETVSKENISSLVNDVNQEILKVIRELMQNPNAVINTDIIKNVPIPPYKVVASNKPPINNAPESPKITTNETPRPADPIKEALSNVSISNAMEEKLKNAVTSDHTVSDYSTPKISTPSSEVPQNSQSQAPKGLDPYRESFQ